MKKQVKRIRIDDSIMDHYRKIYSGISFQRFIELALENQILRDQHKKLKTPF